MDEFAEVARAHADAVLRVAAALVGPADAEDAAQEAILRGWQAWGQLRDRCSARAWLLRITVNVCHDWRRGPFGTHQRMTEPLSDSALEPLAQPSMQDVTHPGATAHAAALDLRRAIELLDEPMRLVVVLRYFAGLDATEIGAALGAPPATIRTRLRRALGLLRDALADSGEWPAVPGREDEHVG
jgi:RNA polymerase sigma-70 factor (ECF subfamily)